MKHEIGDILPIQSYDGEFYIYGWINTMKQIHADNDSYPDLDDLKEWQASNRQFKIKHEWGRMNPCGKEEQRSEGYMFKLDTRTDEPKKKQGWFKLTYVETI